MPPTPSPTLIPYKCVNKLISLSLLHNKALLHVKMSFSKIRVSGFFLVSWLIYMVGRRKLRFVNFGLRIIPTFLKLQNGDLVNTSQN